MFWQDEADKKPAYQAPDDLFDLAFQVRGKSLAVDHAFSLANALQKHLGAETCDKIGVHQIRVAESGNGWMRPEQGDASMQLSRRVKLVIRLAEEDYDEVVKITDQTLDLAGQKLTIGKSSIRKLSTIDTLFAHAIACDVQQSETEFLNDMAAQLQDLGIPVSKMLCGMTGLIRTDTEDIFTRSLLVANLKPEQSVDLQRRGLGGSRLLGCGLFIPHRGIDPIDSAQT